MSTQFGSMPMYQNANFGGFNPFTNTSQYQFNPVQPTFNKPIEGIVRVTGRQGAEAYQLPPNSYMPLFDGDSDTLYIKSTDGAGFGTIQEYQIIPIKTDPNPMTGYATQEQFDALKKELEDVKHSIQQSQQSKSEPVTVSFATPECNAGNASNAQWQSGKHDATVNGA